MNSQVVLRHAENAAEVAACFSVMVLLRPHLASADELVARVARQREAGYRLLASWRDDTPVALAGYRLEETLIRGRFIYVDDLVTAENERGGGSVRDCSTPSPRSDAKPTAAGSCSTPRSTMSWRTAFIIARGCWRAPCASAAR